MDEVQSECNSRLVDHSITVGESALVLRRKCWNWRRWTAAVQVMSGSTNHLVVGVSWRTDVRYHHDGLDCIEQGL